MYTVCVINPYESLQRFCFLFDDLTAAQRYLLEDWEEFYNTCLADHYGKNKPDEWLSYHEDDYAVVTDGDDYKMEWFLMYVHDHRENI